MINCYIAISDKLVSEIAKRKELNKDMYGLDKIRIFSGYTNSTIIEAVRYELSRTNWYKKSKTNAVIALQIKVSESELIKEDDIEFVKLDTPIKLSDIIAARKAYYSDDLVPYVDLEDTPLNDILGDHLIAIPETSWTAKVKDYSMPVNEALSLTGSLMDSLLEHAKVSQKESTHLKAVAFMNSIKIAIDLGNYLDIASAIEIYQLLKAGPYSNSNEEVIRKLAPNNPGCCGLLLTQMVAARIFTTDDFKTDIHIAFSPGEVEDYVQKHLPEKWKSIKSLQEALEGPI